jgi:hypothetical protein
MDKYSERQAFNGITSAMTGNRPLASPREEALRDAISLTCGERDAQYGPPTANMDRLANLIRAYFGERPIFTLSAADAAAINVMIKLARVSQNPTHRDSWVDMAAYAAMGYEVSLYDKKEVA